MKLAVVLHGVGSSGAAMAPIVEALASPEVRVWAPDGPHPFDGGPGGRQFFSVRGVTTENRPERVRAVLPWVWAGVDERLRALGLGRDSLAVVGFSQGAILALAMALDADPPATVVAIAGRMAADPAPARSRTPRVLVLHGSADGTMPIACAHESVERLNASGIPTELHVTAGLGHGVSPDQLARARAAVVG